MENGNGHSNGTDRLDRIERALDSLVQVSARHHETLDKHQYVLDRLVQSHEEFEREHKHLLTAQIVLTERLDRLAEQARAQREEQRHSDERLNALIATVDDWIRRHG